MIPDVGHTLADASDETLSLALRDAELPALMPALAYLTADLSLVAADLRPPAHGPSVALAPQGGRSKR